MPDNKNPNQNKPQKDPKSAGNQPQKGPKQGPFVDKNPRPVGNDQNIDVPDKNDGDDKKPHGMNQGQQNVNRDKNR
jgi:hypothetical protein